jgi:hypothetical protein
MHLAYAILKRLAAGAVFGLYMAYLLYFINPQLDVTPLRMLAAVLTYSLICGVLFGSILWGIRWARLRFFGRGETTTRRHGFGAVTAAAFISALVYWAHLTLLNIYLPRGAIRILSKATLLIAATALVLFVLWLLERNAGRRASRVLFAAGCGVVLLSAFILYQRREGYRPAANEAIYAELGTLAGERRVILVTLRNVPHDWVVTLIGEGRLPNLAELSPRAYLTRVEPFRTTSPRAIWASLASGQLPNRHGVTGRYSYQTALSRDSEHFTLLPSGVGFRAWGLVPPVRKLVPQLPSGDALPLWTLFQRVGFPAAVINWMGTHPAEKGAAFIATDRLLRTGDQAGAFPSSLAEEIERLGGSTLPRETPSLGRLNESGRARVTQAIAADRKAAAFALELLRTRPLPLTVVSFNAIGDINSTLDVESQDLPAASSLAGELIRLQLGAIDRQIGELRAAAPGATLFVVSPSAVNPPAFPISLDGITEILGESSDPGRDDGFVLIDGLPVQHRPNPAPAEVVDLVPTILFAAGLPVPLDSDGRVLSEAFSDEWLRENPLVMIPTYEAERLVVRR